MKTIKVIAISDTHGKWNKLTIPECDILISAGDYSWKGELHMVRDFHKWLNKQPTKHIISVQGNHETGVEKNFELSKETALKVCPKVHFIDEGLVEVDGLRIWGSAITPWFHNWAWNRFPGDEIQKHWDNIPENIDILVTHGPPHGILDGVEKFNGKLCEFEIEHCGCPQLLNKVLNIKPKAHVFGHIHEGSGTYTRDGITFINAAICNGKYDAVNPVREFVLNNV